MLLKMAFRNLFRQRRRSLLTGLSMGGGYMLFVFSMSLLEGSWGNIVDIFTGDRVGHIQIHQLDYRATPKAHRVIKDTNRLEKFLSEQKDVRSYAPRIFSAGLAYATDKSVPAPIIGVDVLAEPTVTRLRDKVSAGTYFTASTDSEGYYEAMIGLSLARALDLDIGDELVLVGQAADGSIANDIFRVSALVGSESSFDRMSVYLPIQAARIYLALTEGAHQYALLVNEGVDNQALARSLQGLLPNLEVAPWQVIEATFYETMQTDRRSNQYMMVLIVFLVFIGVLNTVLMSVFERTREFGVLRAIGMRPNRLVWLIALETFSLAFLSCLIGFVLVSPLIFWFTEVGWRLPEAVDMGGVAFEHLKGETSLFVFLMPWSVVLGTAFLVSIFPGLRAARINPKDAMGEH
ncbi:MAG: ABC transporter permease [Proteobacteria bacterium]|nr:ABC transporter permease [Pseudomonadota bacterium]